MTNFTSVQEKPCPACGHRAWESASTVSDLPVCLMCQLNRTCVHLRSLLDAACPGWPRKTAEELRNEYAEQTDRAERAENEAAKLAGIVDGIRHRSHKALRSTDAKAKMPSATDLRMSGQRCSSCDGLLCYSARNKGTGLCHYCAHGELSASRDQLASARQESERLRTAILRSRECVESMVGDQPTPTLLLHLQCLWSHLPPANVPPIEELK